MFDREQKVLRTVNDYLNRLPAEARWTLYASDASATTLNILVPDLERTALHDLLQLPTWHHESGQYFVSYRISKDLTVSLVDPEFYTNEPFEERMNDDSDGQ